MVRVERLHQKPLDKQHGITHAESQLMTIFVEIPVRTPTLNVWQRLHWGKRRQISKQIATEIWLALGGRLPERPMKHCRITVERVSTKEPDPDSLVAGLKPLLDALQPAGKRHPYGLGIIADDTRECVGMPKVVHVPGKASKTRIWIDPI